jgi:lipopolysaccharide transport system permease protein
LIQPLFTSLLLPLFLIIWLELVRGVPPFLFNLAGITVWNYFTACLNERQILLANAGFWWVYFPRIMPLSIVISNLLKFGIQFLFYCILFIIILRVRHKFKCHVYSRS